MIKNIFVLILASFLGGNIPTVFALITVIFIVAYLVTITTFREIPLKLMEQDELLKPLSAATIHKELNKNNNAVYYIKEVNYQFLKKLLKFTIFIKNL